MADADEMRPRLDEVMKTSAAGQLTEALKKALNLPTNDESVKKLGLKDLLINDDKGTENFKALVDSLVIEAKNGLGLPKSIKLGNAFFSLLSPKADSELKIKKVQEAFESKTKSAKIKYAYDEQTGETEKYFDIPNSIGVHKFGNNFGDPNSPEKAVVPRFDEKQWTTNENTRFDKYGYSQITKDNLMKERINSNRKLTTYGTEIHGVMEEAMRALIRGEKPAVKRTQNLSEEQVQKLNTETENLFKYLNKQYPDCDIMVEVPIISQSISQDMKDVIKAFAPGKGLNKDIDSINGRIDLLVIDKEGKAHIFDYKISWKEVGDIHNITSNNALTAETKSWDSTKKLDIANQMAMYAQILSQYGLDVADTNILPMILGLEYDDSPLGKSRDDTTNYRIKGIAEKDPNKGIRVHYDVDNPSSNWGVSILPIADAISGKYYRNAVSILPSLRNIEGLDLSSTYTVFKDLFPGSDIGTTVDIQKNVKEKDIDWYFDTDAGKAKWSREVDAEGKEYFTLKSDKARTKYYSQEALKDAIRAQLATTASIRATELINFGRTIESAIKAKDLQVLKDHSFGRQASSIIVTTFDKYVNEGWELIMDNAMLSAGYFVFKKGERIEIQVFTNHHITDRHKGSMGHTILGEWLTDAQAANVPEANASNLEGIKTMIVIAKNADIFKGRKIRNISVFNPWDAQLNELTRNNDWLEMYQVLRNYHKDKVPLLDSNLFLRDDVALVEMARDKLMGIENDSKIIGVGNEIQYNQDRTMVSEQWVDAMMIKIKEFHPELNFDDISRIDPNNKVYSAYAYLLDLKLYLNGINGSIEADKALNIGKNLEMGAIMESPQFSSSANIRMYGQIQSRYERDVRDTAHQYVLPMQKAFAKLHDITSANGMPEGRELYREFFVHDEHGNIDPSFRFIDPDDYQGPDEVREIFRQIVDTLYEVRIGKKVSEDQKKAAKADHSYYEVPLMKAAFVQRTAMRKNGVVKTAEEWWDAKKSIYDDLMVEDVEERNTSHRRSHKVFNPLEMDSNTRRTRIQDHGVDYFEMNLETIVQNSIMAYTKQRLSNKYGFLMKGLQIYLLRASKRGNINMQNIEDTIDKFIKNRFYDESIMKEDIQPIYKALSVVTSAFSSLRLGLSAKAFLREMLSGIYVGATRSGAGLLPGLTFDNYWHALTYIWEDLPENFEGVSKLQQLCWKYGMANADLSNLANQAVVDWWRPEKWNRSTLFLGSASPDYHHRMALLIGKMIGDGCWDAHTLSEDGELKYDFKKDKRFSAYVANDVNNKDFLKQKALYLKYLEDWRKQGVDLKMGDPLPEAYTVLEAESIKNTGDLLYGHYDSSTRSLINDQFLGSFFMQFKTYATAKMEQWLMTGGTKNVSYWALMTDPETGEQIYERVVPADSESSGLPSIERITESEWKKLSQEEKDKFLPAWEWKGEPMEGILRVYCRFGKLLFTDHAQLKKMLEDPQTKALMMMGLSDILFMGLLLMLVTLLFSSAHQEALDGTTINSTELRKVLAKEGNYFEALAYSVIAGAAEDSMIDQTIVSLSNVSSIELAKSYWKNTGALLAGNQTAFEYATKSVGALGELRGIASKLADESE